jgi:hypothetical protein
MNPQSPVKSEAKQGRTPKPKAGSVSIRKNKRGTTITTTGNAAQALFDAIAADCAALSSEGRKP